MEAIIISQKPTFDLSLGLSIEHQDQMIKSFFNDKNYADRTKESYLVELRFYFQFLELMGQVINDTDHGTITSYRSYLVSKGFNDKSQATYLSCVKAFYTWLEARKLYPNIARAVTSPKTAKGGRKMPFTTQQVIDILGTFDLSTKKGLRDKAIIFIAATTGLRSEMITSIQFRDFDTLRGQRILWSKGKGRSSKEEYVIIDDHALEVIEAYTGKIETRQGDDYIFQSEGNRGSGQLNTVTLRRIIIKSKKTLGITDSKLSFHSLRYYFGTELLRETNDFELLRKSLHHLSNVSHVYVGFLLEERRLTETPSLGKRLV